MEFICPACSTRLVINGERIRGKRVGFVCKACGASLEVDGRCDPPGIQAREKPVRSPRTSSPALAVEVPTVAEPPAAAETAPAPSAPASKRRRPTPPPLPKRRVPAPIAPSEPRDPDDTRRTDPSLPAFADATGRHGVTPVGPSSEPSLPIGMTHVPPIELSSRASRPDRASRPPLVAEGVLAAAQQARRRRVQGWLAATGLFAALLGGYGLGVLTRTPPPRPVANVAAAPPAPTASATDAGARAEPPPSSPAPTVISIDDLPIAKGSRAHAKRRKSRKKGASAAPAAEIDKEALVDAMHDADRAAAACSTPGGPRGASRIAVTLGNDGHVLGAALEGGALAGSVEGRCVEEKFRSVRVPAFRGGTVTVRKTVRLE